MIFPCCANLVLTATQFTLGFRRLEVQSFGFLVVGEVDDSRIASGPVTQHPGRPYASAYGVRIVGGTSEVVVQTLQCSVPCGRVSLGYLGRLPGPPKVCKIIPCLAFILNSELSFYILCGLRVFNRL